MQPPFARVEHTCATAETACWFFVGYLVFIINFHEISLLLGTIRNLILEPLNYAPSGNEWKASLLSLGLTIVEVQVRSGPGAAES